MPYVPSKKTDGRSEDREILDAVVETVAQNIASEITNNFSLIEKYKLLFDNIAITLKLLYEGKVTTSDDPQIKLAKTIYEQGEKYGYEGAFLGELNYAITRLIQRVPQIKVKSGDWKEEFRYWLYAATVDALTYAARRNSELGIGVGGAFEDIKDEYKRRMNIAYEASQIIKSGDCYDGPYYTRLVEVVRKNGRHVGYQEIMLKRNPKTVDADILPFKLIVSEK